MSVTRVIAARGAFRDSLQNLFVFPPAYQDGWVRVTGSAPLHAFVNLSFDATAGSTAFSAQETPLTSMIFSHVSSDPSWRRGLALLNATTANADVEIYAVRKSGALAGSAKLTIAPGKKLAKLLTELTPAAAADDGYVFVRTTNNVPLFGTELFFTPDLRVIASVRGVPIDPSVAFTPPAP